MAQTPGQPEYDKLFDHDYDGIREYDNPLPGWWKWLFVVSIIFSAAYIFYYHMGTATPTVYDKYESQIASYYENQLQRLGIQEADDATIVRLTHDKDMMTAMAGMFTGNCAQCHRPDGGGNIGPNLTDEFWKNVKKPSDIYNVITNGVTGTAMAAWERRLREPQRILLAAYVASLRGSNPPNPKAPEGSAIPPWPEPAPAPAVDTPQAEQSAALGTSIHDGDSAEHVASAR